MAAERHANNLAYVGQWSYEQHQAALESSDQAHFILESSDPPRRVGYAILEGLNNPNGSILLRRIVVTEKGQGFGRAALKQLKRMVFEIYRAHRFWLDVKAFNPRARHLYESEGFVLEGCLREALKKLEDSYHVDVHYVSIAIRVRRTSKDLGSVLKPTANPLFPVLLPIRENEALTGF